jgi:hypothetical protein
MNKYLEKYASIIKEAFIARGEEGANLTAFSTLHPHPSNKDISYKSVHGLDQLYYVILPFFLSQKF